MVISKLGISKLPGFLLVSGGQAVSFRDKSSFAHVYNYIIDSLSVWGPVVLGS